MIKYVEPNHFTYGKPPSTELFHKQESHGTKIGDPISLPTARFQRIQLSRRYPENDERHRHLLYGAVHIATDGSLAL